MSYATRTSTVNIYIYIQTNPLFKNQKKKRKSDEGRVWIHIEFFRKKLSKVPLINIVSEEKLYVKRIANVIIVTQH